MIFFSWAIIGALIGWFSSVILRSDDERATTLLFIGIVGAVMGGAMSRVLDGSAYSSFGVSSLLMAGLGAALLLFINHLFDTGTRHTSIRS